MMEPRSTATIRALASLAELSADQLEDGASVEDVIATLRKAAEAVRQVVETSDDFENFEEDSELEQDLTPLNLEGMTADTEDDTVETSEDTASDTSEEPVLNAG